MYNTPVGVRVLEGAERRLFVESLAMLIDDVSLEDRATRYRPVLGPPAQPKDPGSSPGCPSTPVRGRAGARVDCSD